MTKIRHAVRVVAVLVPAVVLGFPGTAWVAGAATAQGIALPAAVVHGMSPARLPAAVGTHLPKHLLADSANASATSDNWSGYSEAACAACRLRYVQTSFTVPSVNCPAATMGTSGFAYVSHWAGLDGWSDGTVEQTGVAAYCHGTVSAPQYYAWYEMYPQLPVAFTGIQPGDAMTAWVYWDYSSTGAYHLVLTDVTSGATINTWQSCPAGSSCDNTSAEVITEDPGGAVPSGYDLAPFGAVNYLNTQVTSKAGVHGGLASNGYWSNWAVTMANGADTMASPSAPVGAAAFEDTWNAAA